MKDRVKRGVSTMQEALALLAELERATGHRTEYFSQQWARQKACQRENMGNTNIEHLEARLKRLIDLEESFREGRERLEQLRRRRRTLRTRVSSYTTLTKNLYEAKVGVIEHQKRWSNADQGASAQQRFKSVMNTRVAALKSKWATYKEKEVHAMPISDVFWNSGHWTHPGEAWAVDNATQRGIEAYRTVRSCEEELRRVAREVRNVVLHSLEMEAKMDELEALSIIRMYIFHGLTYEAGFPNGTRPIELVHVGGMLSKEAWDESQEVLKSVHNSLSCTYCRQWMVWDDEIPLLLEQTQAYCDNPAETNAALVLRWKGLMARNREKWVLMINGNPMFAEGLDEEDFEEHRLNRDDAGDENLMDPNFMPLDRVLFQ
ncbi:uncharacterized protein MELLADRAFT_95940 [Melampsora larici-populina 98AG31]|uniref:CxC1-like cysteine cluster associated with KDZ transposases domain-containing protein n=1 Tax=Melampsora larici-populina (strain 98AG31 / pathotype 3-4-7) TaxID=747676 RepID=F4RDU2_MELLP|nr:uncharacterized protein MELLADRAFT_95940 [Melampsora larici-populina 98AG31]EGG09462.1 hypothetical protein MELLADRAFT_95940 [Melampsora larici-populina 98AG31]